MRLDSATHCGVRGMRHAVADQPTALNAQGEHRLALRACRLSRCYCRLSSGEPESGGHQMPRPSIMVTIVPGLAGVAALSFAAQPLSCSTMSPMAQEPERGVVGPGGDHLAAVRRGAGRSRLRLADNERLLVAGSVRIVPARGAAARRR